MPKKFTSRFEETRGGRVPQKSKIWGDVFYGWFLMVVLDIGQFLQPNEYETAQYFIQFSQKLACDGLLIFVFSPEFTSAEPKIVLNIS